MLFPFFFFSESEIKARPSNDLNFVLESLDEYHEDILLTEDMFGLSKHVGDINTFKNKLEKQVKSYKESIKSRKAVCKKLAGKDITKDPLVKKQISKIKRDATKIVKDNKDNPNKMVKLLHVLIFKQIEDIYANMKAENEKDPDALVKSIQVFSAVYIINVIAEVIAILLIGVNSAPLVALFISASVVAPITEEYAKKFAIENGFGETYINLFSVTEMFMYLFNYGFTPMMIFLRFILVLFHRGTYKLMRSTAEKDSKGNLKVNNAAFIMSMFLHGFHNGMAVLETGYTVARTVTTALIGAISTSIKDYKQYKNSVVTECINPVIIPMY